MGEVSVVKGDFMLTPIEQQQKLFEIQQRKAQMYSTSTIVPDLYKNNVGNCYIAVDMARRMRSNELIIMQNLDIIKGKPCFSAKFLIGVINMMGYFSKMQFRTEKRGPIGKIQYKDLQWDNIAKKNKQVIREFDGSAIEDEVCVAYATDLGSGKVLESEPVSIKLAIQEGWYTRDGSKWQTMPGLMLKYRAAAFWARIHCPEVMMGMLTTEEREDIQTAEVVEEPTVEDKKAKMRGSKGKVDMP